MYNNDMLHDLSPIRTALALDANKIAFGILLSTLPQAVLHQEPDLLWYQTGVPDEGFNGVLQTNVAPEVLPIAIDNVFASFEKQSLPFHWHVGPASQSAGIGTLLEARGIAFDETEPGMALDLLALNENVAFVSASRLVISPVTNLDLLRQWTQAWGCGAPTEAIQHWYMIYSGLLFGPHRNDELRLYVGSVDGVPVATVELFLAAGVAAINNVVTIHEYRQQGIGAAMTLMAAREARAAGYRVAVLTASPMGINIYRRLGFQECCQVSNYCWHPIND